MSQCVIHKDGATIAAAEAAARLGQRLGPRCCLVAGHSRDHEWEDGTDKSDTIRLRNAQDVRDREIAVLEDRLAPRCRCGNAARYLDANGVLTCALCPLKAGIRSWRLTDIPAMLLGLYPYPDHDKGNRP